MDDNAIDYVTAKPDQPRRAGPITKDESISGILRCIRSAERLVHDAELLLQQQAPAAAGLAVIALEELSKVELLYLTATIDDASAAEQWPLFWNAWTAHTYKAGGAALMFLNKYRHLPASAIPVSPRDLARSFNRLKECSWYVDYFQEGPLAPGEMLGAEHAGWVVSEARRQVDDEASRNGDYHAWVYDTLRTHARGARTQRQLIEGQRAAALALGDQATADGITRRLAECSDEYLSGSIFARSLPGKFLA